MQYKSQSRQKNPWITQSLFLGAKQAVEDASTEIGYYLNTQQKTDECVKKSDNSKPPGLTTKVNTPYLDVGQSS